MEQQTPLPLIQWIVSSPTLTWLSVGNYTFGLLLDTNLSLVFPVSSAYLWLILKFTLNGLLSPLNPSVLVFFNISGPHIFLHFTQPLQASSTLLSLVCNQHQICIFKPKFSPSLLISRPIFAITSWCIFTLVSHISFKFKMAMTDVFFFWSLLCPFNSVMYRKHY